MAWHVYLLACNDGAYYCGITNNMAKRLAQHNGLIPGGARFTSGRRPVTLLAYAPAQDRSTAQKMEAAIKRLPRQRKLAWFYPHARL